MSRMLVLDEKTLKMDHSYMNKRYLSLFETKKFSDCSFLVENEKILSHKILLASSSPVFEAMLYGPLAVSSEIEIRDILASEFKQMLTFIYTDSVQISSVINAWSLVYIAKKYLIEDLLHYCLNYVKKNIEAFNVLLNYEFADLFNEEIIRNICMNNIQMHTKIIFNSDYHMKSSTLLFLLDQDKFNANEEELFCGTIKWASVECRRQNIDITKDNIRSILVESGILSRIRFLSLPLNEISCNTMFSEILEDDEIGIIKSCKLNESSENKSRMQSLKLCLNCSPRNSIPLPQKMGFRRVLKTGNVYHANEESKLTTKLMVNKCVLVNGFLLPTRRAPETSLSSNYTENLNIAITDVDSKKVVHLSLAQTLMYGTIHTAKITEPLLFEEGKTYDIDITWTSGYLQWSNNEYTMHYFAPSLVKKDVKFEFHDPFDCGFIQGVCYYPI